MQGMKLSELTAELIDEILDIYIRVCEVPSNYPVYRRIQNGWTGAWHLRRIQDGLKSGNAAEWRYGSGLPGKGRFEQYDTNAKFFVRSKQGVYENEKLVDEIICFSFDPNIVEGERADKMTTDFRNAVEELLKRRGLAVEFSR